MKISNLSDTEINVIKNILTMSRYLLLKENDSEMYFPIFRPEIVYSDRLIILDELGFREEYPSYFDIFIGESIILISSPDCTRFDRYYSVFKLEEIEKSYKDILEKRIVKNIFNKEIDLSDFTEHSVGFITKLIGELKDINLSKDSIERKIINIQINKTKLEIGFNIWNLDNYLNLEEDLDYSIKIKIPDFNLEIEANSLRYLILKLYDELEIRGVRKW